MATEASWQLQAGIRLSGSGRSSDHKLVGEITGHDQPVVALAMSGNGSQVAIALANQTIRICSVDGKEIKRIGPLATGVTALAFRHDGLEIAAAGEDKVIRIITIGDGKTTRELKGHSAGISSMAFAAKDGNRLVSGSADKTVKVWNVRDAKVVRELTGHGDAVLAVGLSADGSKLVTGSADKTARLWSVSDGKLLSTFTGHTGPVRSVALSGRRQARGYWLG